MSSADHPTADHSSNSQAKAWLIVGLYIGVVYVTLPVAPRLWFSLSPALISFSSVAIFVLALPLACLAVFFFRQRKTTRDSPAWHEWQQRHVWRITLCIILVLVSWLLILQVAVAPAEIVHLLEYGGLGYLIGWAARVPRFISWSSLGCFMLVTLAGSGDEAIQYLLPNRYFEMRDILLNAWCGTVGLVLWFLLSHPSHQRVAPSPTV